MNQFSNTPHILLIRLGGPQQLVPSKNSNIQSPSSTFPTTLKHWSSVVRWHLPSFTFHRILIWLQHCFAASSIMSVKNKVHTSSEDVCPCLWTWSIVIHFPQHLYRRIYIGSQEESVPTHHSKDGLLAFHSLSPIPLIVTLHQFILSNINYCAWGTLWIQIQVNINLIHQEHWLLDIMWIQQLALPRSLTWIMLLVPDGIILIPSLLLLLSSFTEKSLVDTCFFDLLFKQNSLIYNWSIFTLHYVYLQIFLIVITDRLSIYNQLHFLILFHELWLNKFNFVLWFLFILLVCFGCGWTLF